MTTTTKENKIVIWSDIDLDIKDWKDDILVDFIEDGCKKEDITEDMIYERMYQINNYYLDDERLMLDIQLSQEIICIGDLGLWNGRVCSYKIIGSCNIKDCLYADAEYVEWYVDKLGDLRCDAHHHDGTNHYLYRVIKDNISPQQIGNFLNKIYDGIATRRDITRMTRRLGDEIKNVYGW